MASEENLDEVAEEELLKAIAKLAKLATGTNSGSLVEAYASGARQLAEAHAWLRTPNNSH